MEIQAMKAGLKPRDEPEIDRIFERRMAAAGPDRIDAARFLTLRAIAEDFDGLRDVRAVAARATALGREQAVRAALKQAEDIDDREGRTLRDVWQAEGRLATEDRTAALAELRRRWQRLSEDAKKTEDSPAQRLARRVLANLSASVKTTDADYLKIVAEYRLGRPGR